MIIRFFSHYYFYYYFQNYGFLDKDFFKSSSTFFLYFYTQAFMNNSNLGCVSFWDFIIREKSNTFWCSRSLHDRDNRSQVVKFAGTIISVQSGMLRALDDAIFRLSHRKTEARPCRCTHLSPWISGAGYLFIKNFISIAYVPAHPL